MHIRFHLVILLIYLWLRREIFKIFLHCRCQILALRLPMHHKITWNVVRLLFFWRFCVILRILVNMVKFGRSVFPFTSKATWSWSLFHGKITFMDNYELSDLLLWWSALVGDILPVVFQFRQHFKCIRTKLFMTSSQDPLCVFRIVVRPSFHSQHQYFCLLSSSFQSLVMLSVFSNNYLRYNVSLLFAGFLLNTFCSLLSSLLFSWDFTQ